MRAAPLLMAAPPDYQPQIDTTTRQVLAALLQDLEEHRDCWHDPMTNPDAWLCAGYIHETLQALLSQTGQPAPHHTQTATTQKPDDRGG